VTLNRRITTRVVYRVADRLRDLGNVWGRSRVWDRARDRVWDRARDRVWDRVGDRVETREQEAVMR
jgi:hypothetical protein